jgi:hypothetical protein
MEMIRSHILVFAAVALVFAGCLHRKPPRPPDCLALFDKVVPEVVAVKGASAEAMGGLDQGRPFEGIELALTINAATKNDHEPRTDEEDLCFAENPSENFDRLLEALRQNNIPPTVDFVVGRTWDAALRQKWLDHGNSFGNMTYEYSKAQLVPAGQFIDDSERMDLLLQPVWKSANYNKRYFRYPALQPARIESDRKEFNDWLKKGGYVVVPDTISAHDREFNLIYCAARHRSDQICVDLTKAYFYALLRDSTLRMHAAAKDVMGRNTPQILMFWGNQFTYDNLDQALQWLRGMGARFITLEAALSDPFYAKSGSDGESLAMHLAASIRDQQSGQ